MAGWQHRCNGHELGQTSGNGEGQGGLACCSPWGRQESDTTGQLNNDNKYSIPILFTRKLSFHGLSHNYKLFQSTILTCTLRLPCASVLCHSVMFNSATPWTTDHQVPLSMEFSRLECWRRLLFPTPGDLPDPGIELASLRLLHWQADSLPLCHLTLPYT